MNISEKLDKPAVLPVLPLITPMYVHSMGAGVLTDCMYNMEGEVPSLHCLILNTLGTLILLIALPSS